jgi:hypothetical protein
MSNTNQLLNSASNAQRSASQTSRNAFNAISKPQYGSTPYGQEHLTNSHVKPSGRVIAATSHGNLQTFPSVKSYNMYCINNKQYTGLGQYIIKKS